MALIHNFFRVRQTIHKHTQEKTLDNLLSIPKYSISLLLNSVKIIDSNYKGLMKKIGNSSRILSLAESMILKVALIIVNTTKRSY